MVIGGAVFILPGELAGTAGPGVFLTFIIAALPAVFVCLYNTQLASALPATGANYVVVSRSFHPLLSILYLWSGILACFFTTALLSWEAVMYISGLFGNIPAIPVAIIILAFLALINALGIRISGWTQILLTLGFMGVLIAFVIMGTPHINPELHKPLFPKGFWPVIYAAVPAFTVFTGFTGITEIAGDIKNAKSTLPKGLFLALGITVVTFCLVAFTLTGLLPAEEAAAAEAPIYAALSQFYPGISYIIGTAAIFAILTSINAWYFILPRDMLMVGKDKVFPTIFGKTSDKFNSPYIGVIFVFLLASGGVLLGKGIEEYALLAVLGFMMMHILVAAGIFLMPRRMSDIYDDSPVQFGKWLRGFACFGGIGFSIIWLIIGTVEYFNQALLFWGLLSPAIIYYFARKKYLKGQDIDLDERVSSLRTSTIKEIEEE